VAQSSHIQRFVTLGTFEVLPPEGQRSDTPGLRKATHSRCLARGLGSRVDTGARQLAERGTGPQLPYERTTCPSPCMPRSPCT
jgi:hypothetical protein